MTRTISEINEKIKREKVVVLRADQFCRLVEKEGLKTAYKKVDVVTSGTFGAMCSSGAFLNFGHSTPPIKMIKLFLNNVEVYSGIAAVDGYLGAAQASLDRGIAYGGAHLIEELLRGKEVVLRAVGYGSDCYPRKKILTTVTLKDLNFAQLHNIRNAYQRYNAAVNSSKKLLYTYMGKLLPGFGNLTFSGSGELSPLQKDPDYRVLGLGTAIFLGGTIGHITGHGTQHNPEQGFGTLAVQGNLKEMSPEFIRGATITNYGSTLYVGLGAAIPLLDEELARSAARNDSEILTDIIDYGSAGYPRDNLGKVSYRELKSGKVTIGKREVAASPLSGLKKAREIAELLREWIENGSFLLSEPQQRLPRKAELHSLEIRETGSVNPVNIPPAPKKNGLDAALCLHCGQCLAICPQEVFFHDNWEIRADFSKCNGCRLCADICPVNAIRIAP